MAKITANHQLTIHGTNTRQTLVLGVSDFFVLNGIEARKAGALLDTPDLSFYMTKDGETKASGRFTLGNEIKFPIGDVVDLITVWVAGVDDADIVYNIEVSYGQGSFNDLTTISYNKDLALIAQAMQKMALNQNQGGNWEFVAGDRLPISTNTVYQEFIYGTETKKIKSLHVVANWHLVGVQDGNHADISAYIGNAGLGDSFNEARGVFGISQATEGAVIAGSNKTDFVLYECKYPYIQNGLDSWLFTITVKNYTGIVNHIIEYQVFAIFEDK